MSMGSLLSCPSHMECPPEMSNSAGKGNDDPPREAGAVGIGSSLSWFASMKQPLNVLDDAGGQNGDLPGKWFESMAGRIRSMAGNSEQNNNTPL